MRVMDPGMASPKSVRMCGEKRCMLSDARSKARDERVRSHSATQVVGRRWICAQSAPPYLRSFLSVPAACEKKMLLTIAWRQRPLVHGT
jgi:hypothetical protein